MKFISHGRHYETDRFGVIIQTDHRPYLYDSVYSDTYNKPEYKQNAEILQAMRLGFVQAAHGRPIWSLLDCGYGAGDFINFAKKLVPFVYGHDVTGVPLEGAYVVPELIKADVLTMWDVLEHFPDLSFVRDLPYETICLSLPYCHIMTEGKEWFSNNYKHRKPDEHIRHFNEHSLSAMMDSLGWRTVAVSGHEDIVRKSAHGLQNILSMAFKRKI
jgi:hypothetical protein